MSLVVSFLPFYLSVIAFIAEFTLLYLMFSFLSDSQITSLSISEILPDRKEWKILVVIYSPIHFLILIHLALGALALVPLSTVILMIAIYLLLLSIPFLIILLKKCKKKCMETMNIELRKYVNKKYLIIFLCLAFLSFS